MNPPLLIFRLYSITKDAHWDYTNELPLPDNCAAIAVSGGMADIWERRQGKLCEPDEKGISYPLTPFLHSAPGWVATRIVWALTGPGGRFYPIYRTSTSALGMSGVDPSILPNEKFDILASLKFQSLQDAMNVDWARNFMTCFSDGLGLGFWGELTKLEQKLMKAESFMPFQKLTEFKLESIDQKMQDIHPFLQINIQENGLEWLFQNAPLIVRPEGWEGEDAIFMSSRMSHGEMVQAIRHNFGSEFQIEEYDGDDSYLKWVKWPWPLGKEKKEDPWL